MPACLLTWSDRGIDQGRGPQPRGERSRRQARDPGPVLRLLRQKGWRERYAAAWVLAIPSGKKQAQALCDDLSQRIEQVQLQVLDVADPSDHAQLFAALGPLIQRLDREHPPERWERDVVISAGTPQAQTLWVILVQAGIVDARMLQVIPPAFVPHPHPSPVREVRLDIEGFPVIRALRDEVERLRATLRLQEGTLVGQSEPMRQLCARMAKVAVTDVPVLILGETGSGKELVARSIHDTSQRAAGPFVAENCAAFAEGLLASELFGHEAGAFTGAVKKRRGLFEQAHGGTLFLDEVGEMEPRVQAHLLRVLQDGVLHRLGGEERLKVDVRVIAATHRSLQQAVAEGSFRADLYFRLRGATLEVPALRERQSDIPLLVRHFAGELSDSPIQVSARAMAALQRYPWPGNVRELRAEVVRWGVFCGSRIDLQDLAPEIVSDLPEPAPLAPVTSQAKPPTLAQAVAETERTLIAAALQGAGGNLSRVARELAIDRNTLKRKLARYGLR